ncbi:hypothetical protein AVEN_87728-1 [Araneus ventricosus]|uniref:Uncharacterized protein n=1 Tax=Araneus ventricosus TaxID=182803 RepID=A0A4Y2BPY3_ARAVE|nr:hypothetical protein AVEN_76558-1 [Araneus ventricosus]GBL93777.1 hypothetical protein AVEN_87728-1 [Araneus ventricosus]
MEADRRQQETREQHNIRVQAERKYCALNVTQWNMSAYNSDYTYESESIAALNMAMRIAALIIKDQRILVVNMWIGRTNHVLATKQNSLPISEGVSGMLETMNLLNESLHGALVDQHRQIVPF